MTRLAGYLVACILSGLSSPAWAGEEEAAASSVDVQALEEAYAELLDPFVDQKRLPGYYFALYRDGLPVLVRARGFADEKTQLPPSGQTLYAVASMTKPLSANFIEKLAPRLRSTSSCTFTSSSMINSRRWAFGLDQPSLALEL